MKPSPIPIASQQAAQWPDVRGLPLLRLGFRPFYLGATVFACLALPLWVALWLGWLRLDLPVPPLWWHAHEMLYGFAGGAIVGFLLTAVKAWTGLATPRGPVLGALALLWLAARVAALVAPPVVYALLDLALLPVVTVVLLRLVCQARSWRNLQLMAFLALLALANGAYHLAVLGVLDLPPMAALHAALALIVLVVCVIAGRVVPMFTASATPGLKIAVHPRLELATLLATALALAVWALAPVGPLPMLALALAAVLQGHKLWRWQPWVTRGRPILWILHAAYACLPLGLGLLALAQMAWVSPSLGVHALAVGTVSGLIIGMVTRTARGHTGRPLQASGPEVWAYALVLLAALLRLTLPLSGPGGYATWLTLAAVSWSLAFALYLWRYLPWLTAPRLDGKDG